MPKPVLLWTDLLVFVLVVAVAGCAWYAAKYEHLRASWRGVLRNRLSMAAAVILGAFVAIGLLDSVHFRLPLASGQADRETHYSSQVLSLLDFLAESLRKHHETTYSAPFATHLYTRERARLPDGTEVQVYPRLRYGGAHLTDPARDRGRDILARALQGSAQGIALWAGITWLLAAAVARREGSSVWGVLRSIGAGRTEVPWRVILLMAFVIIVIAALAANLAPQYHIFGTDKVGEDVFYQTLKSIRTGLIIGTLTTLIMLPFAIVLGIMAGYFSGWVDDAIQYLYTTLNSIPGVLLIAAAVLMLDIYMANHEHLFESTMVRADLRLLFLCIILGITSWTGLCRLLRGETLKVRELDYVQAATALGVSHFTIIGHHILPNVMHIVLITVVLDFSGLVLAEAVLSYVGVGIDPTMNSWGNMINSARLELAREPVVWWTLAAAFLFMFTLVLAANLFSDAVRDAFDPRLRSQ